MSRSPLEAVGPDEREDYEEQWDTTARIVRRGGSWSGLELHCTFLNTGGERFADVSAPSGLATSADGRAVAVVDWDLDGDLDLWLANRSAPRLTFQRNESPRSDRWLAVRPVGTGANRDAIGARLELYADGGARPAAVKTVHAGDGFLTQSSRWVHFGLGDARRPDRIEVRWPTGERETFEGLSRGRRYVLAQGSGGPRAWSLESPGLSGVVGSGAREGSGEGPGSGARTRSDEGSGSGARESSGEGSGSGAGESSGGVAGSGGAHERALAIAPGASQIPPPSDRSVVRPSRKLPMPHFEGAGLAGEPVSIRAHRGAPLVVNLWASWCAPCVAELKEMTRGADELRAAGVGVLALSVDGLGADASTPAAAVELLRRIEFPFEAAPATEELLAKLELLHGTLYMDQRAFPLPTSFLVDPDGRLTTIYRGPVQVEELIADARRAAESGSAAPAGAPGSGDAGALARAEALRAASVPFAGRWIAPPPRPRLLSLSERYLAAGHHAEAADCYRILLVEGLEGAERARVHHNLATLLAQDGGSVAEILAHLEQALALAPDLAAAHALRGELLHSGGDKAGARIALARAIELEPEHGRARYALGKLCAEDGDLEAATEHLDVAARLAPQEAELLNDLGVVLARRGRVAEAAERFTAAIAADPTNVQARVNLATTCAERDDAAGVRAQLERVVELEPAHGDAREWLADELSRAGELRGALVHYAHLAATDSTRLYAGNRLAWILATTRDDELRDPARALEVARRLETATGGRDAGVLDTLAAALAATGDFEAAAATARRALALTEEGEATEGLRARIELYTRSRPHRE